MAPGAGSSEGDAVAAEPSEGWFARCLPTFSERLRWLQHCLDPEVRAAIQRDDPAALIALLDESRPRCLSFTTSDINVPLDGSDGSALHMAAASASSASHTCCSECEPTVAAPESGVEMVHGAHDRPCTNRIGWTGAQ